MKLFWTGTDSLMLIDLSKRKLSKKPYWIVFRILVRMMEYYIDGHYCDSDNVAENLRKFGTRKPITVLQDQLNYIKKYPKIEHEGFNVIYYNPAWRKDVSFKTWLYGLDLIEEAKKRLRHVNFIELDGTLDMKDVYPIADFMIRPNRHDGSSRIRQECEIQEIPYYWTNKDPNLEAMINEIELAYLNKFPK